MEGSDVIAVIHHQERTMGTTLFRRTAWPAACVCGMVALLAVLVVAHPAVAQTTGGTIVG